MHGRSPMIFTGLLLAAVACSGVETNTTAPDVMDLTASAYRLPAGAILHVSPERASVSIGATTKLSTTVRSSQGRTLTGLAPLAVRWVSSDTNVARVSGTGAVLGLHAGTATIRAIGGDASSQATVTVTDSATAPAAGDSAAPATGSASSANPTKESTTQPTSPPTPQQVGNSGQASLQSALVHDDFTRYQSTADLQSAISTNLGGTGSPATAVYTDGRNPQLASLDRAVTYNGHATMRYDQPAGSQSTPQLTAGFRGNNLTNFWYKMVVRYQPGWTTIGTLTNSANAYKLMDWGWAGGVSGRGGIAVTNTTQYQIYFYLLSGGSLLTGENDLPFGNVSNEWTSGQWYTYIINYEQTSPANATVRVWKGAQNQTPTLVATVQGVSNGHVWPAVDRVSIGENFNQVRVNGQSLWIGEWSVYDGTKYANPYNVH